MAFERSNDGCVGKTPSRPSTVNVVWYNHMGNWRTCACAEDCWVTPLSNDEDALGCWHDRKAVATNLNEPYV
jgi:hypothetical protein